MGLRRRCQRRRRCLLKADPSHQARLLDLQALDTRLDQIAHARARLPQLQQLASLEAQAHALDNELVNARTALDDVQREVDKAEADVQLVRDRAARDRARLDAGTGTAKDLQALQHEVESLARRQGDLEDIELEVMERAESLQHRVAQLEASRVELGTSIEEVTAARDAALGELDSEATRTAAVRGQVMPGVGPELVALYAKIRASSGGIGAAPLRQRRCGGCRLELTQVDMDRIAAAAEDEVLRCEECRRILVRTPESGS